MQIQKPSLPRLHKAARLCGSLRRLIGDACGIDKRRVQLMAKVRGAGQRECCGLAGGLGRQGSCFDYCFYCYFHYQETLLTGGGKPLRWHIQMTGSWACWRVHPVGLSASSFGLLSKPPGFERGLRSPRRAESLATRCRANCS